MVIMVSCLLYFGINFLFPSTPLASSTRTKSTETTTTKSTKANFQKSSSRKTKKNKTPKAPNPAPVYGADLKVVDVRIYPNSPKQKKHVPKIVLLIQNIGDQPTSNKCTVNMSVWSVNDSNLRISGKTELTNILSKNQNKIPKLDPGETFEIVKDLHSSLRFDGRHKVYGRINTKGLEPGEERSENNRYEKIFNVTPTWSDLVICSKTSIFSRKHVKSYYPVRIRNHGEVRSPVCKLKFWIRGKGYKNYTIPSLPPGEEYSKTRSVYWAGGGYHEFIIELICPTGEKLKNNRFEGMISLPQTIGTGPTESFPSKTICSDGTDYQHTPSGGKVTGGN